MSYAVDIETRGGTTVKTKQELFDTVWQKITEQGAPSVSPATESCMYSYYDGRHCAIGWLIDVPQEFEWQTVDELPESLLAAAGISGDSAMRDFLLELQYAHDLSAWKADFLSTFHDRMRELATTYNLNTPEVQS